MAMAAKSAQAARGRPPAARKRPASRPTLRVVDGGRGRAGSSSSRTAAAPTPASRRRRAAVASSRQSRDRAGVAVGLAAMAVCVAWIFGLVLLNIYVTQTSFRLDALQKQVAIEQNIYRERRYQVSLADSPARLAEVANRLGLVTPDRQESLTGRSDQLPAAEPAAQSLAADSELKAVLAGKP